MSWFGNWGGGTGNQVPSTNARYAVGDIVEYYSASQGTWIPAKVLQVNPSGTYNLDCKPEVPPDKIRPRGGGGSVGSTSNVPVATGNSQYRVGDTVEYYSASAGNWIPAKILQVNADRGTYNLDCKPEVTPDKIRPSRGGGGGTLSSAGSAPQSNAASQGGGWSLLGNMSSLMPMGTSQGQTLKMTAGNQSSPLQLLRVRNMGGRWQYEVCEEGAALLEGFGPRRISVASICGLYRTGKSYLLNLLLERVQKGLPLFTVGNSTNACTEGLWLWGSVDSDDARSPLLAFLDCEGFGSTTSDKTRDAQLMTLCALLSSVLVLNTKGALNESLFNALALVCRFAEHIEERGMEASRPVLLWVLRDFMLELRDASGRPTTPDEYLEQALHAAPTTNGNDQGRSQGAREVRQSLLRFFSHRTCATLVRPAQEESQLQRLDTVPFRQLRSEFRAGVEALRQQLVSSAMTNPKTVGGQPLTCFAFVALLRQFVQALNDKKALSVKGAWETVQHTACGSLADELREEACKALRTLRDGGELQGQAKLPLSDEALRTVLRAQRHDLKSKWEERAVGDEMVRKEYWQELKESLAREEKVVQVQNTRIADDEMLKSMKGWQAWLDSENAGWADGERIISSVSALAERTPSGSLARGMRSAMEAAGRRVTATRHALDATMKQSDEEKQKALAWGKEAAQKEGAARTELQERLRHLEDAESKLKQLEDSHHGTKAELEMRHQEMDEAKERYEAKLREIEDEHTSHKRELEGKHNQLREAHGQTQDQLRYKEQAYQNLELQLESAKAEMDEAKQQVQGLIADMEAARAREQELKSTQRALTEKEASLKASLEEARGQAAKDNAERLASERLARTAADSAASDKRRLEVELEQARADAESYKEQLAIERSALKDENEKTRAEHMRLVEETRKRLEDERKVHADTLQGEKARLIDRERNTGVLEGQVSALSTENTSLRDQLAELREQLRETEREKGAHAEEKTRLQSDLEKNKKDVDDKLKAQADEHAKTLTELQQAHAEQMQKQKCCSVM